MLQYSLQYGLEYALAFWAGVLSVLSPCVLPMLPIIIASSMQAAARYILLLPLGLATCFTLLGVGSNFLFNTFGLATFELQKIAAVIFFIIGLLLIFSACADYFDKNIKNLQDPQDPQNQKKPQNFIRIFIQNFIQKILDFIQNTIHRLNLKSAGGQFLLGFLLALTWSPCIGPTLGIALSLAAAGENLSQAAATMFLYSLGISLPFALIIYLGKGFKPLQQNLQKAMPFLKIVFALLIFIWGLAVLMGWDKALSSSLLNSSINSTINSFFSAK